MVAVYISEAYLFVGEQKAWNLIIFKMNDLRMTEGSTYLEEKI